MDRSADSYLPVGPDPYVDRRSIVPAVVFALIMGGLCAGIGVATGTVILAVVPVVVGIAGAASMVHMCVQSSGRDGVLLAIDAAGIYLGRRPVERITWARVAEVTHYVRHGRSRAGVAIQTPCMEIRLRDRSRVVENVDRDAAIAAVARHAPGVPVSDLGQIIEPKHQPEPPSRLAWW